MNDFNVYVKNSMFGTELSIKNNRNKKFKKWAISNKVNGKSKPVEINETIFGIYQIGEKIDLFVYDNKNKETLINNVIIEANNR